MEDGVLAHSTSFITDLQWSVCGSLTGQGELKRTAGDSLIYHRPYSGDVAGRHQATDRSNVMYDETLSALEDVRAIYVRFQNSRLVVESAIQKARKTAIQDVVNLI